MRAAAERAAPAGVYAERKQGAEGDRARTRDRVRASLKADHVPSPLQPNEEAGKKEDMMVESGSRRTAADPEDKRFFRVGAVATLILVVGWFLTFPVYGSVGIAPTGDEGRLLAYGGHSAGWWTILGLMVFTDLIYVVVWVTLYEALKRIDRIMMLLALASHLLFVVLDLAVTWTNHAALFTLGSQYVAAATEAQREVLLAAAGAPAAVMDSPLATIYSIGIPSLGTLLAGLVMLKGGFGKLTGWLAIAVGITAVPAIVGPYIIGPSDPSHIINALIATVMYVLVGWRLFKLSRQ